MRRRVVREPPLRRALTATRRILVTAGFSLGRRDVCATFFKITGGWEGSLRGGRGSIDPPVLPSNHFKHIPAVVRRLCGR